MPTLEDRMTTLAKPHVLFCVDLPKWAHDFKSQNLVKHLSAKYDCRIAYHATLRAEDFEWADVILIYFWMQLEHLLPFVHLFKGKIVLCGICGSVELEGSSRELGLNLLKKFPGVFIHNKMLYEEFKNEFSYKVYLNENGVDTTFYTPAVSRPSGIPLVVGWAGSLSNHGAELRGYHNIILPAVEQAPGVSLKVAAREDKWRGPEEMLEFYRDLDVYIVASRSE